MGHVFRDAVVQSASTPSTSIPPHAVRTTRRRAEFAVRLKLRSRSRQTRHDCSRSDANLRIRNRRLRSARLKEDCFPAPKQARAINAIPSPQEPPGPAYISTQPPPPSNPTSTSSFSTPANLPTPPHPRPQKPYEIRSILEALYAPIAKESREKPHSKPFHGSLPSGLPSQYDFRGHATPNEVRRFIAHLPAACPPITRHLPVT